MVRTAQGAFAHDGFDYIFWGWLLVAASAAHYALLVAGSPIEPGVVYLAMPLGGLYSWWHHGREDRTQQVETHVDALMPYVWGAIGVMIFLGIFLLSAAGLSPMPFILMFYGTGTFISGGALRFRPLLLGGILFWISTVVSFFLPLEGQIVVQGASVMCGYLVPGYMLLRQHRDAV